MAVFVRIITDRMHDEELLDELCKERLMRRGYAIRRATEAPAEATVEYIKQKVADYYGVTIRELRGRGRTNTVALARQVAMYLVRQLTTLTLVEIGKAFERDHGTVIYAVKTVGDSIYTDAESAKVIENLKLDISNGLR